MLKKLLLALMVVLPFTVFAQKFGVVNTDEVFGAMPATKAAENTLNEIQQNWVAQGEKIQQALNKLVTEYQSMQNDPTATDTMKEMKQNEINETSKKMQQFQETASQDLQKQQMQLLAPIQQQLTEAIQSVGAEGNFTFIFPNEPGLLLYTGAEVVDVTALVKAKLGL